MDRRRIMEIQQGGAGKTHRGQLQGCPELGTDAPVTGWAHLFLGRGGFLRMAGAASFLRWAGFYCLHSFV
jgi:hypothetical protein